MLGPAVLGGVFDPYKHALPNRCYRAEPNLAPLAQTVWASVGVQKFGGTMDPLRMCGLSYPQKHAPPQQVLPG